MRRKLLIGLVAVPLVALLGLTLYAKYGDHRQRIERLVTKALDRRLSVAENVSLAAPDWSDAPATVHVDRLEGTVDLWSFVRGPVLVRKLEIRGAHVVVEEDERGRSSFSFGAEPRKRSAPPGPPDFGVVFEQADLRDVVVSYRDAARSDSLEIVVDELGLQVDAERMVELRTSGRINDIPLEAAGRVRTFDSLVSGGAIDSELSGSVGDVDFKLSGRFDELARLAAPELDLELSGADVAESARTLGLPPVAPGAYRVEGYLRPADDDRVAVGLELEMRNLRGQVQGTLRSLLDPGTFSLDVAARSPDSTGIEALAGLQGFPHDALSVSGTAIRDADGMRLREVRAVLGGNRLNADGVLGAWPRMLGTDFTFDAEGPDLSVLSAVAGVELPPAAYSAAGRIVRRETGVEIEELSGRYERLDEGHGFREVAGRVGDHDLELDLILAEDLAGTELVAKVSGPAADDAARLLTEAGLIELKRLPPASYQVSGDVRFEAEGRTEWRRLDARLDGARLEAAGVLGPLPEGQGSEFSVEAEGPDAALVGAVLDLELPSEPFSIRGSVARKSPGARFDDVRIRIGDYRAEIAGTLGEPPELVGTKLDLHVEGPDLEPLTPYLDLPIADGQFEISARFDGEPERFSLTDFSATLGDSDLRGQVHVDLSGKPFVRGELVSAHFDAPGLQATESPPAAVETVPDPAAEAAPSASDDYWIPDEPLPLERLDSFDADIDWRIDVLETRFIPFQEARLDVDLVDGRLAIGPFSGVGESGGSLSGSIVLEPFEDGYRTTLTLTAEELRLALSRSADEDEERSPHDARVELEGRGRSLHEMAATAEGHLVVIQGAGAFNTAALGRLTADVLSELASSLRITSKGEAGLECGVHVYKVRDGQVRLDPSVFVIEQAKVIGRGKLDLKTEKLDVHWAAKPRRGIGLSASAVTNPYLKLSGTLSDPSITVEPLGAALATAAAWTTGGLSFLAKGFWDRATSGNKICRKARKKAGFDRDPD